MIKKLGIFILLVLLAASVFIGCAQVSTTTSSTTCAVIGTVYAANGTTVLGGVKVWTTGSIIETFTKSDGTYTLNVPVTSGSTTKLITAESGSWKVDFLVTVEANTTVNVATSETTFTPANLVAPKDIAVIKGAYDVIENLITKLGFTYTTIEVSDLQNYDFISTFEAIFINCGASTSSFNASAEANLKNFVEVAGKSLYASDWAAGFVEPLWPSAIDFYGSNSTPATLEESIGSAKIGTGTTTVAATVIDSNLKDNVLGKTSISIYYDLGSWVVISGEGTDTTVLLRGSPLTSASSVIGTNISRKPESSISAKATLSDKPLAVLFKPAGSSKGTVIYTTFHNEAQESLVTGDMEKLLQYYIMTL